jgi:hypothetical protein
LKGVEMLKGISLVLWWQWWRVRDKLGGVGNFVGGKDKFQFM